MLWSLHSESRRTYSMCLIPGMILNIGTSRWTHVFYCCIELLLLRELFLAYGLLNNFYTSVLLQELFSLRAMFALCTKHKLCHACVDFGCWSSLSPASLKILRAWLTVVSVSYISGFWNSYSMQSQLPLWIKLFCFFYCTTIYPNSLAVKKGEKPRSPVREFLCAC